MKIKLSAIFLGLLIAQVVNASAPQQLFNGKDLNGWVHVGSGKFHVKDNMLVTEGGMGLLYYEKQKFSNIKLHVIYKTTYPTSNSGIFVRFGEKPESAWDAVNKGYEIQICDAGPESFDRYHSTGAIYSFAKAKFRVNTAGKWTTLDVILKDEFMRVYINGRLISGFSPLDSLPKKIKDSEPDRGPRAIVGYIGLQNHDHTAKRANDHVYFKEISVQSLD